MGRVVLCDRQPAGLRSWSAACRAWCSGRAGEPTAWRHTAGCSCAVGVRVGGVAAAEDVRHVGGRGGVVLAVSALGPQVSGTGGEFARPWVARPESISAGGRRCRAAGGEVGHAVVWTCTVNTESALPGRTQTRLWMPASTVPKWSRWPGLGAARRGARRRSRRVVASGGRAVAGVFVLPGCGQCGLGVSAAVGAGSRG